jgi:hypothetical protein
MHDDGIARWLLLIDAAPGEPATAQALTREATRYYRRTWPRLVPLAATPAPLTQEKKQLHSVLSFTNQEGGILTSRWGGN